MSENPTTTKAWTYSRVGRYRQTLRQDPALPVPAFPPNPLPKSNPNPEEWILLRLSYAALNPADLVTISVMPYFLRSHRHSRPAVPTADFTGTVIDVWCPPGAAAPARFQKGDDVVCFPSLGLVLATGVGGLQGVVALPARYAVRIPAGRTRRDAAGLLLCGCTADVQVAEAGIAPGQRVLVVGASGGVGSMALQMVRDRVGAGGFVVAVCSGRNRALVQGLGADEVSVGCVKAPYYWLRAGLLLLEWGRPTD